jgi:type I restriction enzyme, R subunit
MPVEFSNFAFLSLSEPQLGRLGTLSERYWLDDPNTSMLKLRQYGELLGQSVAARAGLLEGDETQQNLLLRLRREGVLPGEVWQLFTELRRSGNRANHELSEEKEEALNLLRYAWILGVWYVRSFHEPAFRVDEFVTPLAPPRAEQENTENIEQLQGLLAEAEQARASAEQQLAAQQAQAPSDRALITRAATLAAQQLDLSEAQTRQLIDAQLRAAGWEADTVKLDHRRGTRPARGRNMAIAEWPTSSGPADYVLFVSLRPVAVVEAKRKNKDVMGSLEQAKRYSRGFNPSSVPGLDYPEGPWGEYRVPFLYATNGRPYLRQLKAQSGTWFRDARRGSNVSAPLAGWHSPQGLSDMLLQDRDAAEARLKAEPLDYDLGLRPYQMDAIRAVETALAAGQRELLLAMATGTGKTKMAIALIYRLLKAGRFRRVLFLVDRSSLGEQAAGAFETTRLEGTRTFAETFGLKTLDDGAPDGNVAVHVATVQSFVRRVFDQEQAPNVDTYDLVIVDEAHRGYTLDRELAEAELGWRGEADYVSKYRRVLEHFDAVKIGLTATPALHTTEIFGLPVFAYTYREAVLDGYLIDHEPPHQILTELSTQGIHWKKGEQVLTYTPGDDETSLYTAPDNIGLEVEAFNRRVMSRSFNEVVCRELAQRLDPNGPEKTLIFCVNDRHADEVVDLLKAAFREVYGQVDDDAVLKVMGSSDKPSELIRRFRNEQWPSVAVTVDLLTTGVDVPAICNLVFLRRVGSRILFEQMLGRATRRCDEIGKTVFRIYDAVRAYEALEHLSTMTPVVTNPKRTFAQLADDLQAAPTVAARAHVRDELAAKIQRVRARLTPEARSYFGAATGLSPEAFVTELRAQSPESVQMWLAGHEGVLTVLDTGRTRGGTFLFVSEHADQVTGVVQAYPDDQRPEEYLSAFQTFIARHRDRVPALITVLTRPGDLTRAELRQLTLLLDGEGYSEAALRSAYASARQIDAAASIIGFIRAAADNEAPQPFGTRVDAAMSRLLGSRAWTPPQRNWLNRMASALKADGTLDREAFDDPVSPFRRDIGGFERLDKAVFQGQLPQILTELRDGVWRS